MPLWLACTPSEPVLDASIPARQTNATAGLAGGWNEVDVLDTEVQEAARFATQKQAVQQRQRILFKDVLQAQRQVVAGQNYQLRLQLTQDGAARQAGVVVWRKPNGDYVLSQWTWQ